MNKFLRLLLVSAWIPAQGGIHLDRSKKFKKYIHNHFKCRVLIYDGVIEITMAVHQENDYVEVSVTDDGYGIPNETMKKIFDPFFSTKVGKKIQA